MGLLRQACELEDPAEGPGLVLLAAGGELPGMNQAAGRWLEELGGRADGSDLPVEIAALAVRLRHLDACEPVLPRLRVRTRGGHWAVLHASWMSSQSVGTIAVIVEAAAPADVAPMIMLAYGLSDREKIITGLVCQGLSTRQIAGRLHLTTDTVQDHLNPFSTGPACTAAASSSPRSCNATISHMRWLATRSTGPVRSPPLMAARLAKPDEIGVLTKPRDQGQTGGNTTPNPLTARRNNTCPGASRSAIRAALSTSSSAKRAR